MNFKEMDFSSFTKQEGKHLNFPIKRKLELYINLIYLKTSIYSNPFARET